MPRCSPFTRCLASLIIAIVCSTSARGVEQWGIFEVALKGPATGNPFVDVHFSATFTNALNQHVVTAINEQLDSPYSGAQFISPGGYTIPDGVPFYAAAMNPSHYILQDMLNGYYVNGGIVGVDNGNLNSQQGPLTKSALYGKPLHYQIPRTIRIAINFSF